MKDDLLKLLVASFFLTSIALSSEREFLRERISSRPSNFSWGIPSFSLDDIHSTISKGAWWVSNAADSIFSDQEVSTKPNRGHLNMSIESVFNGEEVAFRPRFKLKVRLSRTKKLLKINFSSDDQLSRILPPPTKSSPNAGVEANLGLIKRIKVSTSTGLRLNTPAHWYWLLRTRYDVSSFDLGLNIRYTTHNKWILHQYYQQRYGHLSFNSDFSWSESDGVTFSQRVGIQLPEIPLVYYLGLNGAYENAFKNQRTFMEIKYENSLYRKKWLRYSVGVRNQYLRETNWKSEVETFARLDGFFGGN